MAEADFYLYFILLGGASACARETFKVGSWQLEIIQSILSGGEYNSHLICAHFMRSMGLSSRKKRLIVLAH